MFNWFKEKIVEKDIRQDIKRIGENIDKFEKTPCFDNLYKIHHFGYKKVKVAYLEDYSFYKVEIAYMFKAYLKVKLFKKNQINKFKKSFQIKRSFVKNWKYGKKLLT